MQLLGTLRAVLLTHTVPDATGWPEPLNTLEPEGDAMPELVVRTLGNLWSSAEQALHTDDLHNNGN